ncbi:replicative DNA helicase [Desulfosarcina sp. OttesenSCG-928-A07]|nr:replicative DNA helicase [Desulfosarcina sp. OttesenSCG-928-A07]
MPTQPLATATGSLPGKLPPQRIEAEESILSAILLDNTTLIDVLDILSADDFYKGAHQMIFSAVEALYAKSEPVDLVTLANILRERDQLEKVGGAAYLSTLVDVIPVAVNTRHYARIIHEKAILRRLILHSNAIATRCFEDTGDVDGVIEFAQSAVFEVSQGKNRPAFSPLSKIIETNIDQLEERQGNRTLITGIPTGFSRLDTLTAGMQNSDFIIIAGRPAMGKTAFALNIARNAAIESGMPVAIFSLEMSKEQLSMRMLCAEARVDASRIRSGFLNQEDWSRITEAAGTLTEAPIFIDDSPDISTMSIRTKSMRMKMDKGLGMVIIDYLQLMRGSVDSERRDLEISEISRSLKILAKELNIPVIALSQLNRKLEERSDKRPQLSDLRESGALEQDADLVAFIYRDEVYNRDENNPHRGTAEIILAKQRNGPTGVATLTFMGAYTRFENMAPSVIEA